VVHKTGKKPRKRRLARALSVAERLQAETAPTSGTPTTPAHTEVSGPTLRSSREDRTAVLDVLKELGPATGVATLRDCFPEMPRVELADLLKRSRRVFQKRYQAAPALLGWQRVGAVWAIDFSEAPGPIDGIYPYVLAVRDLASHQQVLGLPTPDMVAQTAIDALQMLFTIHGAPWS
jgi:hypothetical protein